MTKDPAGNWDTKPLAADHTLARANGGTMADRLLHSTCNAQRGAGDWDNQRPVVTNTPPEAWSKTTINQTPQGDKKRRHFQPINIELV